jgi:hypothetical protein
VSVEFAELFSNPGQGQRLARFDGGGLQGRQFSGGQFALRVGQRRLAQRDLVDQLIGASSSSTSREAKGTRHQQEHSE